MFKSIWKGRALDLLALERLLKVMYAGILSTAIIRLLVAGNFSTLLLLSFSGKFRGEIFEVKFNDIKSNDNSEVIL